MDLWQLMLVALLAAIMALFIRQQRPEMALLLSLLTGVIFFLGLFGQIRVWMQALQDLATRVDGIDGLWQPMLKAILIAYLTEFTAQICRDASEGALAQKVELAGRLGIAMLTIPVLQDIFTLIVRLLG